jgi:uncharacterized membrane protein YcaP (DUF421 family)
MDMVLNAAAVYVILMVMLRLAGRRTVATMTAFDFVLLLVIGEATQQALLGDDVSLTGAIVVIATLVILNVGMSLLKQRVPQLSCWLDGAPLVVVEHGRMLDARMRQARIDRDDVLYAARATHGLERLDQIKYAILEASGGLTIIPVAGEGHARAAGRPDMPAT